MCIYWAHILCVGTSHRVSVPVAKRRMNFGVNRDAGVHSWYLAVSGEFPFSIFSWMQTVSVFWRAAPFLKFKFSIALGQISVLF